MILHCSCARCYHGGKRCEGIRGLSLCSFFQLHLNYFQIKVTKNTEKEGRNISLFIMIFFVIYNCYQELLNLTSCPSDRSIIQFCLWHPSSSLMVSTTFLGTFQVPTRHQDCAMFTSPASTCHVLHLIPSNTELWKSLCILHFYSVLSFLLFIVPGMSYLPSNSVFPSQFNTGVTSFMKPFQFVFFFFITVLALLF